MERLFRRGNGVERLFRQGNGVERLFRQGKGYRRAFRRYGRPEVMYRASRCSLVSWMPSNSGNTS